jgi:hypothetical protein
MTFLQLADVAGYEKRRAGYGRQRSESSTTTTSCHNLHLTDGIASV